MWVNLTLSSSSCGNYSPHNASGDVHRKFNIDMDLVSYPLDYKFSPDFFGTIKISCSKFLFAFGPSYMRKICHCFTLILKNLKTQPLSIWFHPVDIHCRHLLTMDIRYCCDSEKEFELLVRMTAQSNILVLFLPFTNLQTPPIKVSTMTDCHSKRTSCFFVHFQIVKKPYITHTAPDRQGAVVDISASYGR